MIKRKEVNYINRISGLEVFDLENASHNVSLSSAEIANLWTQYINDSLSICILSHAVSKVNDEEIKEVIDQAISMAKTHLVSITEFFNKEDYPVPKGFTLDDDVNMNAPALFTDKFLLVYMHVMTLHGMTGYSGAVGTSAREDQIDYFTECNYATMKLYKRILDLMLKKGIYTRPPNIDIPNGVDMIDQQRYMAGWFAKKRPLTASEISGISYNVQKTVVKITLEIAFGQVCKSKPVQKFFLLGKDICEKHYSVFRDILQKSDLSTPPTLASEVTDSITSPYSEKLMLNHIVLLVSASIGFYGAGLAVTQRRDIALDYTRLLAEIGLYANEGAQLLIENGWLEQPPLAHNRAELAKRKG
ncbi:DUF3231 family protein [Rossellomorea vietnamensis]|uniref:DUF3231 family protein n=1 Tax=Rossellomorea vietnamensis TaxID=218284 RepID=A0A5D4MHL8_9BACI|nr:MULTISPECIES: DUF3231 family protein [Bacillaceae]TYS01395.1 DUF3231 family protein [Rossellomorea vietnamensis]